MGKEKTLAQKINKGRESARKVVANLNEALASQPLNDAECEELMFLYRVARADNATPTEIERLKYLMRRFKETKH